MLRNTAGQKWRVFAFTRSTNAPLTDGASAITAKISIDNGTATALTDTNPTETEDGYYLFDLSQAETNGVSLDLYPESSTSGVQVIGVPGHYDTVLDDDALATSVYSLLANSRGLITTPTSDDCATDVVITADFDYAIPLALASSSELAFFLRSTRNSASALLCVKKSVGLDSLLDDTSPIASQASITWSSNSIAVHIAAIALSQLELGSVWAELRERTSTGAQKSRHEAQFILRHSAGRIVPSVISGTVTANDYDVTIGDIVTLTFTDTSTLTNTYQWIDENDVDIAGETTAVTTWVASQTEDPPRIRVTSVDGSEIFAVATITVNPVVPTNNYRVRGFNDSNYFTGPTSGGLGVLGTARVIATLRSLPTAVNEVLAGRTDGTGLTGGWYIGTGIGSVVGKIYASHRTAAGAKFSDGYTVVAGDVGKTFVIHATCDASFLKLYIGGIEIGTSVVTGGAPTAAASTDLFQIGKFQHLGNYFAESWAIIDVATSASVMTAQQIFNDAATIQDATSNLYAPSLPSEADRFTADDIVGATNWVSRTGSTTLTRTGTLTVEAI